MNQFKKPYLINLVFTSISLIISLIALTKDMKIIVGVIFVLIQLLLLYFKRYKVAKIIYLIQIAIIIFGIVGMGYIVNVDNFGITMIIAFSSMFTSMGVASLIGYFVISHQIAEKSSDLENKIFTKIKILLIIFTTLFLSSIVGFVLSNDENKIDKTNTASSKIGIIESSSEYLLYNCQYYIDDKEEMLKFALGKLKISKDRIEIPISYKDYKDPTKEINDLLEFKEDCSIDYGSQFFACKINITDKNDLYKEIRNTEINFDGNKNFQWKTMTQTDYSKFVSNNKTLLKCDAKKL
jgi:hypothetical protein